MLQILGLFPEFWKKLIFTIFVLVLFAFMEEKIFRSPYSPILEVLFLQCMQINTFYIWFGRWHDSLQAFMYINHTYMDIHSNLDNILNKTLREMKYPISWTTSLQNYHKETKAKKVFISHYLYEITYFVFRNYIILIWTPGFSRPILTKPS